MDIIQFAMRMEREGENYYRELMDKTNQPGLKRILELLANEEIRHYHILEKIGSESADTATENTGLFETTKTLFSGLRDEENALIFDTTAVELYNKALQIEKDSVRFYLEKADDTDTETKRDLFIRLAGEEKKHQFLIENLIDFITRPKTWLENAEWNHLDEY